MNKEPDVELELVVVEPKEESIDDIMARYAILENQLDEILTIIRLRGKPNS